VIVVSVGLGTRSGIAVRTVAGAARGYALGEAWRRWRALDLATTLGTPATIA
jgi:hypothetical protein